MRLSASYFPGGAESLVLHSGLVQTILTTLVAILVTWAVTSFLQRKRIAWRDYLDAPVNLDPKEASRVSSWKILCEDQEVTDPSLVLLRIRNAGIVDITDGDFTSTLEFSFHGRQIRGSDVIECNGESEYKVLPLENRNKAVGCDRIKLDEFSMNRGDRITLLVLLSGAARGVGVKGHIHGGKIIHEPPRRGPRTRTLVFGGAATLLLSGLLAGVFLAATTGVPPSCVGGRLSLEGSTAFAPAATQISQAYHRTCPGASVSVDASGTFNGLNDLVGAGAQKPQAVGMLAMSDGNAPPGYAALIPHPVGVIIFTVVVNKQDGVFKLTTAQLRDIYRGAITNWSRLGGPDLPIHIIGRESPSGTRRTFQEKILGRQELPPTSYDCVHQNEGPASPVIACEVGGTKALLQNVAHIPGAIGYAQAADAEASKNASIQPVQIDGLGAEPGVIGNGQGKYHFWTVEYLYSYGTPPASSLAAAFLGYLNGYAAKDILRGQGYIPCTDRGLTSVQAFCQP
jgi:ABC-type phosphate transport system substrate-binding protein